MTRPAVEEVQRPVPRGATSPWRGPNYRPRAGRAVPVLAAGPPPERAVLVYTRLAGLATPPRGRRQRHPEIKLPLPSVAAWVGCSTRTTKRRLRELRAHGWITATRTPVAGGRGGTLRGRLRVELVWPLDLSVPGQIVGPTGRRCEG